MKRLLISSFLVLASITVHAETEQPPFEVSDPTITENFRQIYYRADKLSLLSSLFTYTFDATTNLFCIDSPTFCVDANDDLVTVTALSAGNLPVNVIAYGAVGDGVTDDTAAIQAAHDAIVATGAKGQLSIPAGRYKCTSQLTFNVGYVNVEGDNAILDFRTAIQASDFVAVHVIGAGFHFGTPWFQGDAYIRGLRIEGPSKDYDHGTGLLFYSTVSTMSPAHLAVEDTIVIGFKHGVRLGSNAYLLNFYHTQLTDNATGFYAPTTNIDGSLVTNAGENISYFGGSIFACGIGFYNSQGGADFNFVGTSFDFNGSTSVVLTNGQASFSGCHFEGTPRAVRVTGNTFSTFNAPYFLAVGDTDRFVENQGYMTISGGRIFCTNTSTSCLYSDNRLTATGLHIQSSSPTKYTLSNRYLLYLPNEGGLITSNGIVSSIVESDDIRVTAASNSNYVGFESSETLASSYIVQLPNAIGTVGQVRRISAISGGVRAIETYSGGNYTSAQIAALTDQPVGTTVYCTNCTTDAVCVSTGTSANSFVRVSARTTVCQ